MDQLAEERAAQALSMLRGLEEETGGTDTPGVANLARRMGPALVSGSTFFEAAGAGLASLGEGQSVNPVTDLKALSGDFWPDEESPDDFVAAVRGWRGEGLHG